MIATAIANFLSGGVGQMFAIRHPATLGKVNTFNDRIKQLSGQAGVHS
jgi:hypothetical protein